MRPTTLVTRASQITFAIAELLFLVFLASPTFIDSVTSEGAVTMLPGYAAVLWCAVILASVLVRSWRYTALLLPLFLAHVGFIILPALVLLRRFRPWVLRVCFSLVFVAGFVGMAQLIGRSERVGFGAYLWLIAAVAAASFCLLPQDDS
jgi:hypothetical protein